MQAGFIKQVTWKYPPEMWEGTQPILVVFSLGPLFLTQAICRDWSFCSMSNRACIWDQPVKGSCRECFFPTNVFYSRLWIFPFLFCANCSFLFLPCSCHFLMAVLDSSPPPHSNCLTLSLQLFPVLFWSTSV